MSSSSWISGELHDSSSYCFSADDLECSRKNMVDRERPTKDTNNPESPPRNTDDLDLDLPSKGHSFRLLKKKRSKLIYFYQSINKAHSMTRYYQKDSQNSLLLRDLTCNYTASSFLRLPFTNTNSKIKDFFEVDLKLIG